MVPEYFGTDQPGAEATMPLQRLEMVRTAATRPAWFPRYRRRVAALDPYLPDFDVSEVHTVELPVPPDEAIQRVLRLPAGSDALVRLPFALRGLRGADLPLERFATEVLGFAFAVRTPTTAVALGRRGGLRLGIAFEAEPRPGGGCRLTTETRVGHVGLTFRLYWLVVGPFSALIRRRWLAAVAAASVRPA